MAGKGAPKQNLYAKKERAGRTIGLYITSDELDILEALLSGQGKGTDKLSVDKCARQLFKKAVQHEGQA